MRPLRNEYFTPTPTPINSTRLNNYLNAGSGTRDPGARILDSGSKILVQSPGLRILDPVSGS